MTGLVLCGGSSARMRRDKTLIPVGGRPLVLHVAGLLERVADPVLLAPGRLGRLGPLGYDEVADAIQGSGPLGGLAAGLAASPHPLTAVVAADMPFASPALFELLADLHVDEDAVAPLAAGRPEPLHAVYSESALPSLRRALSEGNFGMQELLSHLRVRWVDEREWRVADPSGRFGVNLNRQEDLALLEGIME